MDSTVQAFAILIILTVFVTLAIGTQFVRRKRSAFPVRAIPAYRALPDHVGLAIERGRGLHVSFGSAGPGGSSTLSALAANELLYQIVWRASVAQVMPAVTVSEAAAVPLAYGTLQAALRRRGARRLRTFNPAVQWYPSGDRSLAFAAVATGVMANERAHFNAFAGSFGPELALPLFASQRARSTALATSDQLEGQAVAFALADEALLGEEVFSAGAYLGESASALGAVIAQDLLRWLIILALLIATVIAVGDALSGGGVTRLLAGLFSGGG